MGWSSCRGHGHGHVMHPSRKETNQQLSKAMNVVSTVLSVCSIF